MRVCFYSSSFGSGDHSHLWWSPLIDYLAARGHKVTLLTIGMSLATRYLRNKSVVVIEPPIPRSLWDAFNKFNRLTSHRFAALAPMILLLPSTFYFWLNRFDVICVHFGPDILPVIPQRLTCSSKILLILQGGWMIDLLASKFANITVALFRRHFYSARKLGSNCFYIPLGVDCEKYSPASDGIIRQKLGIDSNEVLLLSVAHFDRRKKLGLLVKAFSNLLSSGMAVKLVIVGIGLGPKFRQLKNQVSTLNLQRAVKIVYNVEREEELVEYYRACDLFVLPGIGGLVFLEAMASGKPAVAARIDMVPELIVDGVTGVLVDPCDERQLSHVLSNLVINSDLRIKMGHEARVWVKRNFELGDFLKRTSHLIEHNC